MHWGVGHPDWSHRSLALICEDEALDLVFFGGTPSAMLASYTALIGRAPELPLWGLGVWLSRAYYKTPQEAERIAARLRAEAIPCDVITLDGCAAWELRTCFDFTWDPARFPDPPQQLAAIRRHGLRLCIWEYPLVSIHSPRFEELAAKGWLLKKGDGSAYVYPWDSATGTSPSGKVPTPPAPSGLLDFTHPAAYAWWRDQHKALFDIGVDVITSDFGEQVPADCVAHNGDTGARLHNVYPLLYNQCVYEATEKFHPDGAMVWGRAGWTGAQRCPIQWGGNPQSDWEGLAASVRGGLSWGLSGVPFHASDIGGFYGSRQPDAELYVRWTQWSVFSSHLRFHGIGEREPWAFGADIKALVLRWLRLRYRLLPYLHALCTQASATGLPVMRALPLAFPDDARLRPFDTHFMCGDSLLIAPIVAPGGKVDIALPEGRWVDVRTGQWHDGGTRLFYHAALDDLPVFGRAGYVLPLGRIVDRADAIDRQRPLEELWLFGETQELTGQWRQCTLDTSKRKPRLKINDRALKVRRFT